MKLNNLHKILCIGIILLLGTGWEPIPEDPSLNGNVEYDVRGKGGAVYIRFLPDGTKCAVLDGVRSGGIDCDWAGDSEKRQSQKRAPDPKREGSYYER